MRRGSLVSGAGASSSDVEADVVEHRLTAVAVGPACEDVVDERVPERVRQRVDVRAETDGADELARLGGLRVAGLQPALDVAEAESPQPRRRLLGRSEVAAL